MASFPIVGIGASAGGLEAFRRLLSALPADTGMAYVLVQHLDPSHESILAELLSEATSMDVSEVKGDVRVEQNCVYVIPPANALVLVEDTLKLVPRSPAGTASMPIDSFLGTLAQARGSQAIGVILSGMGSDGTLGLQAIEAEGGIAFAQEPSSARSGDMPRSATAAGGVDFVLTPEAIAGELSRLGRHPYLTIGGGAGAAADTPSVATTDEGDLTRILDLLRRSSGTDFSAYKKTTLRRRIARRMAVSHIETLGEYARRLEGDVAEAAALYEDCLISVTSFFRDPDVFRSLSERVLPLLLKDRPPDAPVRVWVPGCATGEEAYSIAMCLLEQTSEQPHSLPLQIFATDLSDRALAKARDGSYLVNIAKDVTAERLRRFFVKVGDHYQISRAVGDMCVFARHDLTRDPPYSRIDLISCRNLLIYLEPRLQEVVFETFHYALRPEGFLVLGSAEIQSANEELSTLNQELQDRNAQLARSNIDIQRGLDNANALVDTVPQPLVILDGDLRVENANVAFYEAFQVTAEQTLGRLLPELGSRQWDRPELLTKLSEVLVTGASLQDLEIEADFPRIGSRTMSVNARRLHGGGGAQRRLLLAIEDRTEVQRAERGRDALFALEHHARKQAEGADHLKDQFVATVSHELRGPLTVISGWMNILQVAGENPDASTLARALAAIGRGVTAQNRLISDLLDHSRIVTGKVELERVPIDLLTVAQAALVGVRAAAEAKDIAIQLSGEPHTGIVLGDSDRMQQVLWNLLTNAVKFTPRGGRVWVSVGRVGNRVHVTVRDTGCGISSEFLPHVFDRFRQAEDSSNRAHQGLGLGLALVRELVDLHGGTVQGESPGRDRGATFTIVLPIPAVLVAPVDDVPSPPSVPTSPPSLVSPPALPSPLTSPSSSSPSTISPPPERPPPQADVLEGTRIVVVDDDADARDALVRLLERYGAVVRSAASAAEAMRLLETDVPDVLVSDLGMPIEDGYELMRRVRLLPPEAGGRVPSLAVSAYATRDHRERVSKSGFQKHLEKPVAPGELVTEVARLAGRLT